MMEKQTGRKIKELQIGNVERYKNQFQQFGQNNGIGTHFTNRIHELAKEINHSLLEKARCLLYNVQFDKSFCVEVIGYASHLINGLSSTVIEGKTLLDIWLGGATQDYGLLRVFESPTYFCVKDGKVNLRAKKFVLLGVNRNMKGYNFGTPKKR